MALPNLGKLSLRPAAVLPTGEFHFLSPKEADERNVGGGDGEPITHEKYVPSEDRTNGGEYFRVRYTYRNTPSFKNPDAPKYLYHMFDAESLWLYTRKHGRNPSNREHLWREDWRMLHHSYGDPNALEPRFVAKLPSLDVPVNVYAGGGQERRLMRTEWRDYEVQYYEGDAGEEHLVHTEWPGGEVQHYKGDAGKEHLVRTEWPGGEVQYYKGDAGKEYKVRTDWPGGMVRHYKGDAGKEYKVRTEWPDGEVQYYEGDKDGEEHLVRTVLPDGTSVQ